jgi:hypothetical protein
VHKIIPTSRIKVLQSLHVVQNYKFSALLQNNKFSALQQIYDIYPAALGCGFFTIGHPWTQVHHVF